MGAAGLTSRFGHRAGVPLLLVALTATAAVLRAGPLGPSSLWLDDAAPALVHRADSLHLVLVTGMTAPGFTVLLRLVLEAVGFSELAAQALPFAVGVAGPPLAWWAGRQAGLRSGAVVAAGVLLAAPEHLVYSSRVKPYTLDAALCLLVLVAALAVVRSPGRSAAWARLAGTAGAAFFVSAAVAPTVVAAFAAAWCAVARARALPSAALVASGAAVALCLGVWAALVRPASSASLAALWSAHFLPVDSGWPAALVDALTRVAAGVLPLPGGAALAVLTACAAVVVATRPALALLLLGPLVVSVAVATAGVLPLGGGRTDVHLAASLALLVGAAADRLPLPPAVLLVGALALAAPSPPPYPASDVRPLVEVLDRERTSGEGVLVYSATRWAFGVYASGPVDVVRTSRQANGFEPVPRDPDVHVLAPHRDDPEAHRPEVRSFACDRSSLWFLASHTTPDVDVARAALAEAGFTPDREHVRPGASLQHWARSAAGC